MLLCLQRYEIHQTYKKGKEMHIADALFRAYPSGIVLKTEAHSEFHHQVEGVNLSVHLPVSSKFLDRVRQGSSKDTFQKKLALVIVEGWLEERGKSPVEIKPYYNSQDELSIQNSLLFKSERLIIPATLKRETIGKLQSSHMGMEGSLHRTREAYYWPLMNAEICQLFSMQLPLSSLTNVESPCNNMRNLADHG